jgi:tetratricopeptide (TPR) repeat protein
MTCLWLGRRHLPARAGLVATLLYLTGIFPVLGFLNVYGMFISDVADRWFYLPSIPLITLLAAGLAKWSAPRWLPWCLVPCLAVLTWRHSRLYADDLGYWQAAVAHNPDGWCARNNLADTLARRGKYEEAARELEAAIRLRPGYAEAWFNQGGIQDRTGQPEKARESYEQALRLRPDDYPDAHNSLGLVLTRLGRHEEAGEHFEKAVAMQPLHYLAHNNLGNHHLHSGRFEEALESYQRATEISPGYADAYNNIGLALLGRNKAADAVPMLERAISLRPGFADALNNLGHAFLQLNQTARAAEFFEKAVQARADHDQAWHNLALTRYLAADISGAITAYEKALNVNPSLLGSLNNLAWILATYPDERWRDGKKALTLAAEADRLTASQDATVLHTLAAAQAECGDFSGAVSSARHALETSKSQQNAVLIQAIREQLQFYESRRPFRDTAPAP